VPKGGASVVSLCVGCFRAPGIQEAVLNCTACIQLVPLSGPGRLLPHVRQAVLSPIVSMQALQCPSQVRVRCMYYVVHMGTTLPDTARLLPCRSSRMLWLSCTALASWLCWCMRQSTTGE
jgi:hypothetical protein